MPEPHLVHRIPRFGLGGDPERRGRVPPGGGEHGPLLSQPSSGLRQPVLDQSAQLRSRGPDLQPAEATRDPDAAGIRSHGRGGGQPLEQPDLLGPQPRSGAAVGLAFGQLAQPFQGSLPAHRGELLQCRLPVRREGELRTRPLAQTRRVHCDAFGDAPEAGVPLGDLSLGAGQGQHHGRPGEQEGVLHNVHQMTIRCIGVLQPAAGESAMADGIQLVYG
ncbi:hypothetical protein ACFFX0_22275 [Citricoccus parietis]|uniref:Uncharacterized protein n=1 Tax=Citricoccus parietis TaxID=592307 RepID=A0ABV5G4C1_9MICC